MGVIGQSGVGKSTLLNALISERLPLLPQGGIGPLTAVPIEVRHAEIPYLKVGCVGSERVHQMLEACIRAHSGRALPFSDVEDGLLRMATLLACGSQFGQIPISTLYAFLHACSSVEALEHLPSNLAKRVCDVRRMIDCGDHRQFIEMEAGLDLPGLMAALADHGGGALAPLTASIELGWDAPMLADEMILVDLPGLGVANDIHPLTTQASVAALRTVLLVVDRSGLAESGATILRRLFSAARCPADSPSDGVPSLLVAVTKLDQVASEMMAREAPGARWEDVCSSLSVGVQRLVHEQLELELSHGSMPVAAALREAFEQVDVVPVFPLEYQRLHRSDPEDPARFKHSSATGIPELMARLRAFAKQSAMDSLT